MAIGQIVTRITAEDMRSNIERVHAALDGCSGQEKADALMLALVEHIEAVHVEHRMELARGITDAIISNVSKTTR